MQNSLDYKLDSPSSCVKLPEVLNEISGLDFVSKNTLACVQDETATIFFISIKTGKIKKKIVFGKKGDFEGLSLFKKKIFVLRSDGRISCVSKSGVVSHFDFKKDKKFDMEGLCLDKKHSRLLVACKSHAKAQKDKGFIFLYAFSLKEKKYATKPVFKISKEILGRKFQPSGIAIDADGQMYIPSAYSKQLLILSPGGEIIELVKLKNKKFIQAEGICFGEENELFISNEGGDGRANLLTFKRSH